MTSKAICARIESWSVFQDSNLILSYLPMKGEVDLYALMENYPHKSWVLPRILPEEDNRMVFHPFDPERLIQHPFGMAEPAPDLPEISPVEIELSLVPGLAFDRQGWRLGYGGGYFDRFLKEFDKVSLGVVYQALLVERLPYDEYDVPVDWLVTESGVIRCGTAV